MQHIPSSVVLLRLQWNLKPQQISIKWKTFLINFYLHQNMIYINEDKIPNSILPVYHRMNQDTETKILKYKKYLR